MKLQPTEAEDLVPFDPALDRLDPSDLPATQADLIKAKRQAAVENIQTLAVSSTNDMLRGFAINTGFILGGVFFSWVLGHIIPEDHAIFSAILFALAFFALGFSSIKDDGTQSRHLETLHIAILGASLLSFSGVTPEIFGYAAGVPALAGYGMGMILSIVFRVSATAQRT